MSPPDPVRPPAAILALLLGAVTIGGCEPKPLPTALPPAATAVPTTILLAATADAGRVGPVPVLATRDAAFAAVLDRLPPVMPLGPEGLDGEALEAQRLALGSAPFVEHAWSVPDHRPLRSEIVAVRPVADYELAAAPPDCQDGRCYRVTMYNHAENMTTQAVVDVDAAAVLEVGHRPETQPDLNPELENLAWQLALGNQAVLRELGATSADDPMPGVEKALHRSACEQSRHLCAAPTFLVDGRALWVIVDLTAGRVVGMRWMDSEASRGAIVTEGTLLGEYVDANYCRQTTPLSRSGWDMAYAMTLSDGLRLTDVRFKGKPILRNADVVDWHVSYSREAGFGYSDAVGCPFFSSAAVPAMEAPRVEPITEGGAEVGFALVQDYVHPLWPAACMYRYQQRYEFYADGRFRPAVASYGGGCGNDGTYRPVIRVVPAADAPSFAEWNGSAWQEWNSEGWQHQDADTQYTPDGYQYRLGVSDGTAFGVEPGRGQFGDGGRGDSAWTYVTAQGPEELGDLVTIGPCCNADYRQGPEKFIEPEPESLQGRSLALWYVPELKNDDTPGAEYCWARADVQDGLYVTQSWPCVAGPMFVPVAE